MNDEAEVMNETANKRKMILSKANECVNGQRDAQYGNPENNFQTIAMLWMNYLEAAGATAVGSDDIYIRPKDVAAMLALLKISRIATGAPKLDNCIDLAGYAACGGEIDDTNE